ncbi:MAG: hypothetical protein WDN03_15540 [Rhizomicrobium sp.]
MTYPDATPSPSDNPVVTYLYEDAATVNAYAITGIIDENGHRYATWAYDGQGRVVSEGFRGRRRPSRRPRMTIRM